MALVSPTEKEKLLLTRHLVGTWTFADLWVDFLPLPLVCSCSRRRHKESTLDVSCSILALFCCSRSFNSSLKAWFSSSDSSRSMAYLSPRLTSSEFLGILKRNLYAEHISKRARCDRNFALTQNDAKIRPVIPLFCTAQPLLRITLRHPRWRHTYIHTSIHTHIHTYIHT